MVQQYAYSRSPDHPYALEMLPLPKEELDGLRTDARAAYNQLFPAVQAAVRFGSDGEVFNVAHRNSNAKSMAMWTTAVLFGSLEEVAALYLDQNGRVPMVLDSARSRRLYELERPTAERPLHGAAMRWSLWKPPSKTSDGRDVCFLEYMDSFVDRETAVPSCSPPFRRLGHGYIVDPAATWKDGYAVNGWGSSIDSNMWGAIDNSVYGYGTDATVAFVEAEFNSSGYNSLGQFIETNQVLYSSDIDEQCGYTVYDDSAR
ncbi:unnamed protein product [Phytophthora lilii]|uniref:Unnamed protein product n=1 Tax=Phytophthora lilii TaxID=2077276 RepID=A0A9W6WPV4_9STRA|nr:unnamed protein product [Phytophthora lilii]